MVGRPMKTYRRARTGLERRGGGTKGRGATFGLGAGAVRSDMNERPRGQSSESPTKNGPEPVIRPCSITKAVKAVQWQTRPRYGRNRELFGLFSSELT